MTVKIAIEPNVESSADGIGGIVNPADQAQFEAAIESAGGTVVPAAEADALLWSGLSDPSGLIEVLDANPSITWVQLPWAGVEKFAALGVLDRPITFTCAKEIYGSQVGEHTFALIMACLRSFTEQSRASGWHEVDTVELRGKRVTILGAGGIAQRLIQFLNVAGCFTTVLRKNAEPVDGAHRTLPVAELHSVLPETDVLVLALALTPESTGIIGADELALLPAGAVLVNVARGAHVDTDALVSSLETGHLSAAGLDVTNPEPLPDGHRLWSMDNVLITSHSAHTLSNLAARLAERVGRNVALRSRDEELEGLVGVDSGY